MPLLIHTSSPQLLIWGASESTSELRDKVALTAGESDHYATIALEKRRREFLVSRLLFQSILPGRTMRFLSNGKPVTDDYYFSLSHSSDLAGIIACPEPCGIDIQKPDEKILRISSRFCSPEEIDAAHVHDIDPLLYFTILWSAKEAVFKCYGEGVVFAQDIFIPPFDPSESGFRAHYQGRHGARIFELERMMLDGSCIVSAR